MNTGTPDVPAAFLERFPEAGGPVERIPIRQVPFIIGRAEDADHTIYSSKVSKEHARVDIADGRYVIRDLDSTNGTFVNGKRISCVILENADIVHVAHVEFCFRTAGTSAQPDTGLETLVEHTQHMAAGNQPHSLIRGTELLRELIDTRSIEILFQPIVNLRTRTAIAYEALARGTHPELSTNPAVLLALAERCGMVIELSRMLARQAVTTSTRLPGDAKVFVNMHPQELSHPDLVDALTELVSLASPSHPIVLEIAEASVTDVVAMGRNKEVFSSLGLQFAYDDFGAGQARLIELTDIPPDYLKFDKGMIEGIESAEPRREMVGALLRVVRRLGVRVIAEGVETELVAEICQTLGCDLGQGFLFGRPA